MSDRAKRVLLSVYIFAWVMDWGYYIHAYAYAYGPNRNDEAVIGLFIGMFWPVHLASEFWSAVLS